MIFFHYFFTLDVEDIGIEGGVLIEIELDILSRSFDNKAATDNKTKLQPLNNRATTDNEINIFAIYVPQKLKDLPNSSFILHPSFYYL
ncbi:hypothetical protein ATZ36_07975 [Candidatus Endomicrobiellum trichonymphae]|uniref:Uncharacterized protein n=1 Tax=Endomicrobium trichonymphae TaxID=1408204 RepID=A0A1E5IGT2_ENDTX|nr:hypothetical protein ATZ36_07975 [Candidatus Endomicrobium trichonymphae]